MANHHGRIIEVAPVASHSPASPMTEAEVALNIASRREELHRVNPGAVALSATCVFAFHEEINGSLTTALRSRSGSYAREQGTGHRALTFEDVCELVIAGGAEGRRAVRALLAPVMARLESSGSGIDAMGAAADFLHEACDVPNAMMLGKSSTEVNREIREAREALRVLEQAMETRDRVSAPLADALGMVKQGGRQ